MSVTTALPAGASRGPAFGRLAITELRLYLRERIGPVWGVGFPVILLIIFGSIPSFNRPNPDFGGQTELDIYVPVLIAFVTAMLPLVALPVTLTGYRERGVLRRLRTTPVGPGRLLAAQLVVNLAALTVTIILLLAVARLGYGVRLPRQFAGFVIAALFGAAALLAVGLFVAAIAANARAAQAIGTILFFPMMFFAGLWLPIAQMPPILRHLSHAAPLGAAVQALQDSAQGDWPHPLQLVTMAAYALGFGLAANRLFRWE
jgi:ABC-2 type transport system permease protein